MSPKQLVQEWIHCFNAADIDGLAALCAKNAVSHMFATEFGRAEMTCIAENIFEDGVWAILEWRDPKGLRGCGFFQVKNNEIAFQHGYFDQLSFFRQQGIAIPQSYLSASGTSA